MASPLIFFIPRLKYLHISISMNELIRPDSVKWYLSLNVTFKEISVNLGCLLSYS